MDIKIPDVVDPQHVTLTFTTTGYQALMDEVMRLHGEAETARQAESVAKGELKTAQEQFTSLTAESQAQLEGLNSTLKEQSGTIQTLTKERETAAQQITTLREELAAVRPIPGVPFQRGRVLGFTIENGKTAPDAKQYGHVRTAMDWGQRQGLNVYRMFLNPTEMRNHAAPPKSYILGNLIQYGTSRGLRYMADTMDRIAQLLPNDDDLKAYCDRAEALGCEGFYINDGDRKELPLVDLMTILLRLRKAAPGMPLFVSLMGNANLALYSKLLDRVEIQTFGSDAELTNYLAIKAIPCLDLRRPLTAEDIRKKANIIAAKPPRDLFFYADLASDYEAMPDEEDAIIRDLIAKLKAA